MDQLTKPTNQNRDWVCVYNEGIKSEKKQEDHHSFIYPYLINVDAIDIIATVILTPLLYMYYMPRSIETKRTLFIIVIFSSLKIKLHSS